MLEQEIKKLGYEYERMGEDDFSVLVVIPEWDINDYIGISEDDESYIINDGGWEDPFYKSDWTLSDAIKDHFKPVDEEDHNGVKRDNKEVYELLQNLKAVQGADELLEELSRVMSTDDLADALEDVADNWDIEVNEDGTIY